MEIFKLSLYLAKAFAGIRMIRAGFEGDVRGLPEFELIG